MNHNHIPAWLEPLLGERERRIISDPKANFWQVDDDGERLPPHQQIINSKEHGQFTIDAQKRQIIG